jgi:hypothetical protein
VPRSNTWACLKTRFENRGAKGATARIISSGQHFDHLSLGGLVTSVPYPFCSQLAKVELQARFCNDSHLLANPVPIDLRGFVPASFIPLQPLRAEICPKVRS